MSYLDPSYPQDEFERAAVGLGPSLADYGDLGQGYEGLGGNGYGAGYGLQGGYGLGGGYGLEGGYGSLDAGYGGLDGIALGDDYLWDSTSFLDSEIPLEAAWGGDEWSDPQYQLSDLIYYSQQLELDQALTDAERQRRFEERLAWEELGERERALRWRQLDLATRQRLGLTGGWWASRYDDPSLDLSYLRNAGLRRGVFGTPFRSIFSRHRGLGSRFSPFLSRTAIRGYGAGGVGSYGGRLGGGMLGAPGLATRFGSAPLASGSGFDLRTSELQTRLRLAETRASMTGLSPEARARALDDARRIREQMSDEFTTRRNFDRDLAADNRLDIAREQAENQREMIRDIQMQRDEARLLRAGGGGGLYGSSFGSAYGSGVGPYGGFAGYRSY